MTRKTSEKGQKLPVTVAVDAETLYQRYLHLRAERVKSSQKVDPPVTELKKVNNGDIPS